MKRAMISCPMNGLSEFDVELRQRRATEWLQNNGYWIAHSFISTPAPIGAKHKPVWYLAKSLETMCEVDAVFFVKVGKMLEDVFLNMRFARNMEFLACMSRKMKLYLNN